MKIYNRYVLTVALALFLTTIILVALGRKAIDLYYTIDIVEALVITELYAHFSAKASRGLALVSTVLFIGFGAIVVSLTMRVL